MADKLRTVSSRARSAGRVYEQVPGSDRYVEVVDTILGSEIVLNGKGYRAPLPGLERATDIDASIMAPGGGGGGAGLIGGVAIGALGAAGSIYEGFKLAAGDEFDALPQRWTSKSPAGKYTAWSPINGQRVTAANSSSMLYIDPDYRGRKSQSPVPIGIEPLSVSASVLAIKASLPADAIKPFLPNIFVAGNQGDAQGRPNVVTGSLQTWPSFMASVQADHIAECWVRFPAFVPRQYFPSYWLTSPLWPDGGEVDVFETRASTTYGTTLTVNQNIINNTVDGGAPQVDFVTAGEVFPQSQLLKIVEIKKGNEIIFLDDAATPGVLVERHRRTGSVGTSRLKGGQAIRLELATITEGGVFTPADWAGGVPVEFDRWRVWTPAAGGDNTDLLLPAPIKTTPGGSWAGTIPATATLSKGKTGVEQISGWYENADCPGFFGRSADTKRLPKGMSLDATTRVTSGTVPMSEGGRVGVFVVFGFDDGTPAARALQHFDVAPAVQVALRNLEVVRSASGAITVPYAGFHSGNLGPHTIKVTSDKSWVTVSQNDTAAPVLNYTAPSGDDTATLTYECTNAVGQKTTVTRTVRAVAALTASFRDDFDGTVGNLGARSGWTLVGSTGGDAAIAGGGILKANSGDSGNGTAILSADQGSTKQTVETVFLGASGATVALSVTDSSNYIGIARYKDTSTEYLRVLTAVSGTRKVVATFADKTATDTTVVQMSYDPSTRTLTVKADGVTLTPATLGSGGTQNGDGSFIIASADVPPVTSRAGVVPRISAAPAWLDYFLNMAA